MGLQDKNLADLRRESPTQRFSCSTALRVAQHILQAICEIHSIGFLHRDIKPSNFAVGRTLSTQHNIYMLDFGLARLYLNAKGEVRTPRSAAGFRGTVRYAAISAHKNKEMGRQDDLWSLFYMLIEFLNGSLPWRRIKDKDEVGRMKEEADIRELLDGNPSELHHFAEHLSGLTYGDLPDYELLEDCLCVAMKRLGIGANDPFDWENGYAFVSDPNSSKALPCSSSAIQGDAHHNKQKSSQIGRSYTTAFRENCPDVNTTTNAGGNKNKGLLDTQAPITGDEDGDEEQQTGNYIQAHLASNASGQIGGGEHSYGDDGGGNGGGGINNNNKELKPKYKRQEFLRPKINQNLVKMNQKNLGKSIDAVNERFMKVQSNSPVPIGKRYQNGSKISATTINGPAPLSSMSNVSRSDENKLILLPERRAESMQPQTLNVGGNSGISSPEKPPTITRDMYTSLQRIPTPSAPVSKAGTPTTDQHQQINNPSKSTSTPTLRQRNGSFEAGINNYRKGENGNSRERLNKYAAAGSPAIYQQQDEHLRQKQKKIEKSAQRQLSPQKYSVNKAMINSVVVGDGKEQRRERRSSRDELIGSGVNLISHFKNLVNSFNSLNIANRSGSGGRSKSLSSRGFGGDKHKLSNPTPTPPTILKPSDSRSSRKGSSKLSAPSSKGNNEDTSATSGIGSASPTIRHKSRERITTTTKKNNLKDNNQREYHQQQQQQKHKSVDSRRSLNELNNNSNNQTILLEQYTKELLKVGQQQRREGQQQRQQQQQFLLKHNGRYLGNL